MFVSILENVLYGLVSGVAEFLPISAAGHQAVLRYLFGTGPRSTFQDLLIHISVLVAILVACREDIVRLFREQRLAKLPKAKRPKHLSKSYYDLRLLKTAMVPLVAGLILLTSTGRYENRLPAIACFFLANGIILLIAEHTRKGNRDAKMMSVFDGAMIGLTGVACVLPGVSRTGMILSYSSIRGAKTQNATGWAILLGIPTMLFYICNDMIRLSGIGELSTVIVAGHIMLAIATFCGAYIGISALRLISAHSTFSQFAYYTLGAAIFTFILYLLT